MATTALKQYPPTIPEIGRDVRMGLCSVDRGSILAADRRSQGLCDTCDRWNDSDEGNPYCVICEAQDEALDMAYLIGKGIMTADSAKSVTEGWSDLETLTLTIPALHGEIW